MKKFIASVLALFIFALPAIAETYRVFVAETDNGAVLIDENGVLITGVGDYDVIDLISYGDCPAERQLFMVSKLDLSDGFFLDDFGEDDWADGWNDELDEVEMWPDTEGLDEGYDMEIVDDVPIGEDTDELDEFEDYLSSYWEGEDAGYDYGVALMNARGELITGFDYVNFQHDVENGVVAAYSFEGFVTMLDEQGRVLAKDGYTSIVSNGEGGFIAVKPDIDGVTGDFSETAPIIRIAADGTVSETGFYTFSYETLPGYYDGLMCAPVCDMDAGADMACKYVYLNAAGENAFGMNFEYAGDFSGGVAEVIDADYEAWLINTDGQYVAGGYGYFDLGFSDDGAPIIANLADGGFDIISRDDFSVVASFRPEEGEQVLYAYHSGDGLVVAASDTGSLLIDAYGKVLYRGTHDVYGQTWYEFADSQPGRMVLSSFDGATFSMCVAELDGTPVSEGYPEIMALSWVDGEGRYLVLDYELIQVEYDDVIGYEPDMDTFSYGVIDHNGETVIEMQYDYFAQLAPDRYWAAQGGTYRMLDADGNIILEIAE